MDSNKLGTNLVAIGLTGVIASLIWWFVFYTKVGNFLGGPQHGGLPPDAVQCLIWNSGSCGFITGIANAAGEFAYQPIVLWISGIVIIAGIAIKTSATAIENSSGIALSKQISRGGQEPVISQTQDLYSRLSLDARQILVWAVSNGWIETRESEIGITIAKRGVTKGFYSDLDVIDWGRENGYFQRPGEPIVPNKSVPKKSYDVAKWTALLKYDDDLKAIADKFANFDQKWSDEFAADYLAINDKAYLPEIVKKIIARAKAERSAGKNGLQSTSTAHE